jgi:ABC-type proline/glycine betaine transport system ATPase subunit
MIVQQGAAEEILANPANDCVAKFVEDVDMTKVIAVGLLLAKLTDTYQGESDGSADGQD